MLMSLRASAVILSLRGAERVAAVDKIEDKRKPDDFIGNRNRRVPAGGGTFLFHQESTQRMRHRGGAELFAPANKAALPYVPVPARFAESQ